MCFAAHPRSPRLLNRHIDPVRDERGYYIVQIGGTGTHCGQHNNNAVLAVAESVKAVSAVGGDGRPQALPRLNPYPVGALGGRVLEIGHPNKQRAPLRVR
jgi:hypothetical protein